MTYINQHPEASIILINSILIAVSYFLVYPKYVKNNLNKLAVFDIFFTLLALIISGFLFSQLHLEFNALVFTTNWFWFSLLVYIVLGSIVLFWYKNKYSITLFEEFAVANDLPDVLRYMKYTVSIHLLLYVALFLRSMTDGQEFRILWGIHVLAFIAIFLVPEYQKDKSTFYFQFFLLLIVPSLDVYKFIRSVDICDASISCLLVGFGPASLLYIALLFLLIGRDYFLMAGKA